jgi:hypothetical protein
VARSPLLSPVHASSSICQAFSLREEALERVELIRVGGFAEDGAGGVLGADGGLLWRRVRSSHKSSALPRG